MEGALAEKPELSEATVRARATFLEHLKTSPNVTAAAEAAGVTRQCAYKWRDANEDFAAAWEDALEASVDRLEAKAFERAEAGLSDRLAEILLKAHRPKYREKQQIEHTGKVDVSLEVKAEQRLQELGLDG